MSFSDTIKTELAGIPVKSACCRHAFAAGLIFGSGQECEGRVTLSVPQGWCASLCEKLLYERLHTDISVTALPGRGRDQLSFDASVAAGVCEITDIRGLWHCQSCEVAFLRGAFIASATVSDPHSASYHAEFVLADAARAKTVYELLSESGCQPKIIKRKNGIGLYYKNSGMIEELLVTLGANTAAFGLMNCKIERTIRNDENRATNCVARNISKTVSTSRRQTDEIESLAQSGRLEALPYELRVTAKLRLDNPEASLTELAGLHIPPISKSGLNHRLQKLSLESRKK